MAPSGKRVVSRAVGACAAASSPCFQRVLNEVESHTVWEVYRPDGKLVGRTRVPRAYQPWGMTRNGDVLASYLDPDTDEGRRGPADADLQIAARDDRSRRNRRRP
ncbi:MAG: hypothetical protein ABW277_22700, partial [Longimicrobiaceae bacterium]